MKSAPIPISVLSARAPRDTRNSPFGTPHGLFGASPIQVGLSLTPPRPQDQQAAAPPQSPVQTSADARSGHVPAHHLDATRIPGWLLGRMQIWSGIGSAESRSRPQPARPLTESEAEFTSGLRRHVQAIQGLLTRIETEPVNALVLGSLFRSSLKLVGFYKNLMSQPGFEPAEDRPAAVLDLVMQGRQALRSQGDPLQKTVNAIACFVGALCIEPRDAGALSGLLKSAEHLSAVSWKQFHAVPPELRKFQRQFDDRQQLVDAMLAPGADIEPNPDTDPGTSTSTSTSTGSQPSSPAPR